MADIKTITEDILLEIGGNPANKGFDGIVSAIVLLHEKQEYKHDMNGLYREVASVLNTKATRIERTIRHEKEIIFMSGDLERLNNYFPALEERMPTAKFLCVLNLHVGRKVKGETNAD